MFLIGYFNYNFLANNHLLGIIKILSKRIITGGYTIANHTYVLFAILWSKVTFGSNEFKIRLPSAVCGIAVVFFIYKLGSLLFDKKTGLISAFILAISPFHIYYSQEFRMHSFITLLAIASVYSLIRFLKSGKNGFLILYIIFSTLNMYSYIAAALVVIAEMSFLLVFQNKYKSLFKKLLIGHVIIFIFLIPELLLIVLWLKTHSREVFLGIRVCPITEYGYFSFLCSFSLFSYYRNYLPVPRQQRIGEHSKKEYKKATNYIIDNFRAGD